LGAVLYQEEDGKKQYISFASSALSNSEAGYGAAKRELLGVIFDTTCLENGGIIKLTFDGPLRPRRLGFSYN
jgi:hypothetical protein